MGHFLPFDPPNYTKDQNFEKLKKNAQRYYHFTLVYHKQRSYDISFLRHQARQTNFFVILGYFLFFNSPPPTKQKIKYLKKCALLPPPQPPHPHPPLTTENFEKSKKIPTDIIILHKSTIYNNHMIHGSWDINCNRFFLGHFLPFYPPNSLNNENIEKKTLRYHHFTQVHQKSWS